MSHSAARLGSLYQALILEHYRQPRNRGSLADADARVLMNNPTCGDEIDLSLKVLDHRVQAISFLGQGCAISQASASMMSDLLRGRTLEEAAAIAEEFTRLLQGVKLEGDARAMGDLRALAGVSQYPARVRCALLAWNAFAEAVRALPSHAEATISPSSMRHDD